MNRNRLEAFSDGVIAILITIMVLELKAPHNSGWGALLDLAPIFWSYVLSFVYIAIYWNNHHHMLHTVERVNGAVLWANMHLLFWLSLIPFTTAWMSENLFAAIPVFAYGVSLLCPAVAYLILSRTIIRAQGEGSELADAVGSAFKEKISIGIYLAAIALALYWPYGSVGLYALVAAIWFVPDSRIEKVKSDEEAQR